MTFLKIEINTFMTCFNILKIENNNNKNNDNNNNKNKKLRQLSL